MKFLRSVAPGVIAVGFFLAACGHGSKAKPMVADPASSSTDSTSVARGSAPEATAESDGGGGSGPPASTPSDTPPAGPGIILQGNEEGARALLTQFVSPNADHPALTRSLRPTSSDYKTLFVGPTAAKVEAAQAKDWDSGKAVIKPKPGQTEIKIWSATGADLAVGKGAAREFPNGYKKVGKHLAPTQLFFRFKFVEAGKDTGTAYDGLAFVNGHWVITPKPWRAMQGKSGGIDEGDTDAADIPKPAKAGGKKPKGKKK